MKLSIRCDCCNKPHAVEEMADVVEQMFNLNVALNSLCGPTLVLATAYWLGKASEHHHEVPAEDVRKELLAMFDAGAQMAKLDKEAAGQ